MHAKTYKSPYNWVISPLTQPQVANQQEKKEIVETKVPYRHKFFDTMCVDLFFYQLNLLPRYWLYLQGVKYTEMIKDRILKKR